MPASDPLPQWTIRPAVEGDDLGGVRVWPDRWKPVLDSRSLVAVVDGEVVGRCLGQDNQFHPDSRVCEVEVLPAWRRRGIGSALVRAQSRLSPRPLRFKVNSADEALRGLCSALGAVTTQMCPPWRRVVDDGLLGWARDHRGEVRRVEEDDLEPLLQLYCEHYVAQHASWSPSAPIPALVDLNREDFETVLDTSRSFVVEQDGRIVAASLVWPDDDLVEVAPICDRFEDPSRRAPMEACLAATFAATTPGSELAVDCHLTNTEEFAMVTAIGSVVDPTWLALVLVPSAEGPRPDGLDDQLLVGDLAWARFDHVVPPGVG